MIEKGFYNSSTPNVGVISRDVGAIFVAGLYNAFYEANQERKAYISNENSFHNGQESLIKIIQEMWLKNSNDFFRISKEYNKVIKKIIMRNLCVINGILYQEFISYKNSECAKKYLMEYRHNINVKRNEKRQNNEREKLKYKDEIINLKDELSKKRNELDKYGFAIFGEKASKKRNLKNQINNLKSKIEENELKLELLSNSMNEINGLFQADYIYTHKYKDGGYIQDRNEVYVKYNKENKVYSIYLKRDDLLIGDMEESFNTLVGSYNRKFYGVIENICLSIDSNNDKEGLFIIILKEIS